MRWTTLSIIIFASSLFIFTGCADNQSSEDTTPIRDPAIVETYPDLYNAVLSRDAQQIVKFTSDSSIKVQRQAWRALAQTPVDSLVPFVQAVKQNGSDAAWFALSMHELTENKLRKLEEYWSQKPEQRAGISRVLGRQGDKQTLAFLWNQADAITGSDYEYQGALAISRLFSQFSLAQDQQHQMATTAFSSGSPKIIRAWLYGFYRADDESLSTTAKDTLYNKWQNYGLGRSADVDQYVAKIIAPAVFAEIADHYFSDETRGNVQLGIELAHLIDELSINKANRQGVKQLLQHKNPHVVQQTLANLSGSLTTGDDLLSFIKTELIDDEATAPVVWLEALKIATATDSSLVVDYKQRLNNIADGQPYVYPQTLQLQREMETDTVFLDRLEQAIETGDALKSMYAVNALSVWWNETEQKVAHKLHVRSMTFDALALRDRGVSYSAQPLLQDSILFSTSDFVKINQFLNKFSLPGDIEVYQTFGALYKQRFEEQAQPVIDSLAALEYIPLNRSLKQAGWDVDVPEEADPNFRAPDWERLWKLGKDPVWILETKKGTIKVEMNTLSAPATISAIDSLTRAGAYNGVPFHRVVPNFVIQGGDIERQDGFGGPDFTIPTEASETEYARGAAGIASAGPDTEGSQYFFMHQWKPHLNGRYTLFGNVIEGMAVVDRIIVGDKVEKAYWE